jgi:lactate/malate dehydrogenase, NAD binding domain
MAPRIPSGLSPHIAIVGAGDLGGALAFSLAVRGRVGRVRLIDEAGTSAAGKALDVQQSTPVYGSAVQLEGAADLGAADGADVVVLADAFGASSREHQGEAGLALLRRLATRVPSAVIVLAGASQAWLVEKAVTELGLPWTRVIGSAPLAVAAGLRTLVGLETGASPLDVQLAITGLPPDHLVVAWESASIAGVSLAGAVDRATRARIAARLPRLWPPGPIALAAAAAAIIEAMVDGSHRPCSACLALDPDVRAFPTRSPDEALAKSGGERVGVRGVASASLRRAIVSTVWLGRTGVVRVALPELSAQERVALDNARGR